MAVDIRLYNINSDNEFKVEYALSGYTNPFTLVGTYPSGTTTVTISGVSYNTDYFVKITDNITGQYIIQTISTTDETCYSCISGFTYYCYKIDTEPSGNYNYFYTGVTGQLLSGNVNNSIVNICALEGSITYSGYGPINLSGGVSSCSEDLGCLDSVNLFASGIDRFGFRQLRSSLPYYVEWQPGVYSGFPANWNGTSSINGGPFITKRHYYSSPYTGLIKIKSNNLNKIDQLGTYDVGDYRPSTGNVLITGSEISKLKELNWLHSQITRFTGDTSQLPTGLTYFQSFSGSLRGDVANAPRNLTNFSCFFYESNVVSGNTIDLPRNLVTCNFYGSNTITGYINDIPTGLTTFVVWGNNTISGNTAEIPQSMKSFSIYGDSYTYGDIANIPTGVTSFVSYANSIVSGDTCGITNHSLISLYIDNDPVQGHKPNTIFGDINCLPKNIRNLLIGGENTISGNTINSPTGNGINNMYYNVKGFNTLTGDINYIPKEVTNLILGGYNTISGHTSSLPPNLEAVLIDGNNTLDIDLNYVSSTATAIQFKGNPNYLIYTGKTWTDDMNFLILRPSSLTLNSTQIDNLLIDLTGYTWTATERWGSKRIEIKGSRTSASNAAVDILTGTTGIGKGINLTFY